MVPRVRWSRRVHIIFEPGAQGARCGRTLFERLCRARPALRVRGGAAAAVQRLGAKHAEGTRCAIQIALSVAIAMSPCANPPRRLRLPARQQGEDRFLWWCTSPTAPECLTLVHVYLCICIYVYMYNSSPNRCTQRGLKPQVPYDWYCVPPAHSTSHTSHTPLPRHRGELEGGEVPPPPPGRPAYAQLLSP